MDKAKLYMFLHSSIFWQVKHSCESFAFLARLARYPKWWEHSEGPFLFFEVDLAEGLFFWGLPEKASWIFFSNEPKGNQYHRDIMVCLLHIDLMKVKYGVRVFSCAWLERRRLNFKIPTHTKTCMHALISKCSRSHKNSPTCIHISTQGTWAFWALSFGHFFGELFLYEWDWIPWDDILRLILLLFLVVLIVALYSSKTQIFVYTVKKCNYTNLLIHSRMHACNF
jgi:hypothetical protein